MLNLHPRQKSFAHINSFFFHDLSVFSSIHLHINSDQLHCLRGRIAPPQHDAATNIFPHGDDVLRVMYSVGFPPHKSFAYWPKSYFFCLTLPEHSTLMPSLLCISLQMDSLGRSAAVPYFP
ncbi:hypothetical protein XENORESO_014634 [Xenotaenia resolanae]|uniref:Uncharacterized protein n=1 Tax=Xenotaenia resolanae TaxID=208358 RepID=A0ABV0W7D9_9TELE